MDGLDLFHFHKVYDVDGTTMDEVQVTQLYKDTFDRFKTDHPDFSGAKIIFAPLRRIDNATMTKYLKLASKLKVVMLYLAFMIKLRILK